ncbi:MAG: GNAT family N-acetyltransferase [Methanococcoides sp.]|nr:GNAT family N-acetyltransferase [Methanococcoides sp.]
MNDRLDVLQANLSHVSFLSEFGKESFIDAYKVTLPMDELRTYVEEAFSEERIKHEVESSESIYLICKNAKGVICGYAKYVDSEMPDDLVHDRVIELQRLYVQNECRGKGVGRLLSRYGESISQQKGFKAIWLRVWDGNTTAQQIYLKWGYTFCSEEAYQVGQEKRKVLIMMKHIQASSD